MATVPKFGSFKRRGRSDVKGDEQTEAKDARLSRLSNYKQHPTVRQESQSSYASQLHRSSNNPSPNGRRADEGWDRHHDPQKRPTPAQSASSSVAMEPAESDLFLVDLRGDPKNVEFGSLHRYSVPLYHKTGYGRVLGAPADVKIDRDASTATGIVLSRADLFSDGATRRSLASKSLRLPKEHQLHKWKPMRADLTISHQDNFIPLRNSAHLKRKRDSDTAKSHYDAIHPHELRSTHESEGLIAASSDEDWEDVSDSNDTSMHNQLEDAAQAENAALIRQTIEHPTDSDGWLALIDHQARLVRRDVGLSDFSPSERRSLAEIRLSIYRKALQHLTPGKPGREALLIGMLEQGGILWDSDVLRREWRKALDSQPFNIDLWSHYMLFLQTDPSNFQMEIVKGEFIRGLRMCWAEGMDNTPQIMAKPGEDQLCLFVMLTCFLRDAGYDELAIGLWQLFLESQFFKPAAVIDRTDGAFWQELEAFWESEVPRIGEEGAHSWAAFRSESVHDIMAQPSDVADPSSHNDAFTAFAELEIASSRKLHLPARADDDDTTSDPFRFVMFSDMEVILRALNSAFEPSTLIDAYLCFLGLPALPNLEAFHWRSKSCCYSINIGHGSGCVRSDAWTLFQEFSIRNPAAGDPGFLKFVDRTFSLLVKACPASDTLAQYHAAFRAEVWPDTAAKLAKGLIKQDPTSLGLYNAYALLEASHSRMHKAEEVWSTALKMSGSLGKKATYHAFVLWQSWIKTSIYTRGDESGGLQCLLAMCEGSPDAARSRRSTREPTASEKLRAIQYFATEWDGLLAKKHFDLGPSLAECHMWFTYLTEARALEPAMHQVRRCTDLLAKKAAPAAVTELLLQQEAAMISYHVKRHRPYQPAALLKKLQDNIRLFPNNTVLLRLYVEVKASFRMDDYLRGSLDSDLLTGPNATVAGWSVAIDRERRRYGADVPGTTSHAVRALFRKALLGTESCARHCPALWIAWLEFEQSILRESSDGHQRTAAQRLKQVVLDGLRHLPWYKHWIILSLHVLTGCEDVRSEELRQLYDVLIERGLRVRASTEAIDAM